MTREERTAPAEWARAAFEVSGSPLLRGLAEATRTALRRLAEALLDEVAPNLPAGKLVVSMCAGHLVQQAAD
ncbi:hypothetical protein, partial [Saccharopolyspora rectivirgula]|uniref:hypothetical protein n=1 Tax=Saccharopolyspora rectivirgula TaxID=28042 RepID=UPI000563F322